MPPIPSEAFRAGVLFELRGPSSKHSQECGSIRSFRGHTNQIAGKSRSAFCVRHPISLYGAAISS